MAFIQIYYQTQANSVCIQALLFKITIIVSNKNFSVETIIVIYKYIFTHEHASFNVLLGLKYDYDTEICETSPNQNEFKKYCFQLTLIKTTKEAANIH